MKRVLCVPFAPVLAGTARNCAALTELAQRIAETAAHVDAIVLPELALSGYLLESLVGEAALTHDQLGELAQNLTTSGMPAKTEWILGLPLREKNQIFNVAAVLADGNVKHIQRKLFLPTYGMFDEARYFTRGMDFTCYEGALGKTAILICEDAWHLELAYAASLARADTVVVISASPARGLTHAPHFSSTHHWRNRLQVCAESYGQSYVYCNRSGTEDGVLYDASTFAVAGDALFIAGHSLAAYEKSMLFELPSASARVSLSGDSSRQNDAALVQKILSSVQVTEKDC